MERPIRLRTITWNLILRPSKAITNGYNDGSFLLPSIVKLTIVFLVSVHIVGLYQMQTLLFGKCNLYNNY